MSGPVRSPRPPVRLAYRLLGWCQALLAVVLVAVLLGLAAANVLRARWSEAEDGVLTSRPERRSIQCVQPVA